MENENIRSIQEALSYSPDNIPLRLHLAELFLKEKMIPEASEQFRETLNRNYGNTKAQLGLAECYYHQKKYSAAVIVYEQIQQELPLNALMIYIRCLIKENSMQHAAELYQKILVQSPGFKDEELDQYLRLANSGSSPERDLEEDILSQEYFMESRN